MKLLPEEPTQEMDDAYEDAGNNMFSHAGYKALYAAAPEVNDAPVAWIHPAVIAALQFEHHTIFQSAAISNREHPHYQLALYTHPSPRIAELEQEVSKLRGAIRKLMVWVDDVDARKDAEDAIK